MNNNKIFEKVKMKIAISSVKEEDIVMNKSKLNIGKGIGIAACIVLSTTGVVFATNYNKIVNYFGLGGGIDSAVEHGYIENPNMDYVESDTTAINENLGTIVDNVTANVRIEDFLMDDLNLSTHFLLEFDKKINEIVNLDNLKNIELKDLLVTDENGKIIYCMNKEMFEKYCGENNLDYEFAEFNDNYYNCGLNSYIEYHYKEGGITKLTYNMYSGENFPKSKKLNFIFTKITLVENEKQGENIDARNRVTLVGDWNISLDVPEKMYNRQTIPYKVVSCSNKDFNIATAFVSDTGFEIGIIIDNMEKPEYYLQIVNEEIKKEVIEGKITEEEIEERRNMLLRTPKYQNLIAQLRPIEDTPHALLNTGNIEDTSYVENEKGEKFETSSSPSRRQDHNFIDGNKFSYYETFELTKYNITNKLKVQIMLKGEPVIIELEKK